MDRFIVTSPETPPAATLLLAHGAGAPMDSRFMNEMADLLAARGIEVLRFEFPYMVSRRVTGKRKPAPKAELLKPAFDMAITDAVAIARAPFFIGGKSMGGRVASMVADAAFAAGQIKGLVCFGYPFHPPGTPEATRTAHLEGLACPALVIQGERDPFGTREDVEGYRLSAAIALAWIGDGDHDFGPRGASGLTRKGNLSAAADAAVEFLKRTAAD
jgi:predicted alpha/beta-hydrolase family hydrolase